MAWWRSAIASRPQRALRQGPCRQIKEFTWVSSPYKAPENAELRIDTGGQELQQSVEVVIRTLQDRGVIPAA